MHTLKIVGYVFAAAVGLYVVLMNAAPLRVREAMQRFQKGRAFGLGVGLILLAILTARLVIYLDRGW